MSSCLRVEIPFSTAASVVLLAPAVASAQIPGFDHILCRDRAITADHVTCSGDVELKQPGMTLYADQVDFYPKTNRLIATGNVLVEEPDHHIAAERADFDAVTRLGTFFNASGFAALGKTADVSQFGTLQPDVQFYGKTIEKTGPQTYLISHGGFTTCAQANPRWEMTSGSIKLHLDHYALLRNMFLKAKGVPVLFLPALYYPIGNNARQTGFLMPSYGSSSYRGQVISNGFFWAIGRSQDATVLHDWYSKTGQAINGEYRYVSLKGGGNINNTFLNEKATIYKQPDGTENPFPGQKSFTLNGSLSQALGGSWYAQARANYFSSIQVQQRSTVDIYKTSQHNRVFGGSTSGTLHGLPDYGHLRPQRKLQRHVHLQRARQRAARHRAEAGSRHQQVRAGVCVGHQRVRAPQPAGSQHAGHRQHDGHPEQHRPPGHHLRAAVSVQQAVVPGGQHVADVAQHVLVGQQRAGREREYPHADRSADLAAIF